MGCLKLEILDNFIKPKFRVQRPCKIVEFSKVNVYLNGRLLNMIDPTGMMADSTGGSGKLPGAPESSAQKEPIPLNQYQMPMAGAGGSSRDNTNVSSFRQTVNPNQSPVYQGRNDRLRETPGAYVSEYDKAVSFGIDIASFGSLGALKLAIKPATIKNIKLLMNFKNVPVGTSGVYDLGTTLGKYIGQSKDIIKRVTAHFASGGKLKFGELENAVFHAMPGSTKLEREVYEQFLVNKYGIENLINQRLPMGGRKALYDNMIDDVINQFNLPR